jgi:hypothetical protein
MTVHVQDIETRIRWLLDLGAAHARDHSSPEASLARQDYLARHPTRVIALVCMDGRIHIPHATDTPLGIILSFRNLGGIFDLGWPHLGGVLNSAVQEAVQEGRPVLLLITYHFSRGDPARGCAGFDCDTRAAFEHTCRIRGQVEAIFGQARQTVYPLVCGFETDEDALILHGPGETLDVSTLGAIGDEDLAARLRGTCPDMPERVLADLLPLVRGNLEHVGEMRGTDRDLEIDHREWAICVGRGFEFLQIPNVALIVGPYSPNLREPITCAAGIIRENMRSGRIPDDGFLLLASVPYSEIGPDRNRAVLKARFLSAFAAEVIGQDHPALHECMRRRTAVVNWPTRALEEVGDE